MVDHGIKRPDYLAAFMDNIKWEAPGQRCRRRSRRTKSFDTWS